MKWISVLLTVMILGGSFAIPCSDELEDCCSDLSGTVLLPGEHSLQADLCSPFCGCHCCHSHSFQTCLLCLGEVTFFESIPSVKTETSFDQLIHSIWDPPETLIS